MITLLLLCLTAPVQQPVEAPYRIEVEQVDGEPWCSILADQAPLHDVLTDLAERLGWTVEGLGPRTHPTPITAQLRRRPVADAVEFVLGSAGLAGDLRRGTIRVRPMVPAGTDSDELRQFALVSYMRAHRRFPDHPIGDELEFGQSRVQEARGNLEAAKDHLVALIERHPESELVSAALLRASSILMELGQWQQAEILLSQLVRRDVEPAIDRRARLMIARCAAHMGDPRRALLSLDALEHLHPPLGPRDQQDRLYLRALALNGLERHYEALAVLDTADTFGVRESDKAVALEQRAVALEGTGAPGDAARTWLAASQALGGTRRAAALENAARLALQAGDELGALFVYEHADQVGAAPELEPVALEARARLGLDSRWPGTAGRAERLARAERLLEAGLIEEALGALKLLWLSRQRMEESEATHMATLYARCLDQSEGVDHAVAVLVEVIADLEDEQNRRRLYLLAARLYEDHERYDEAVRAYRGELPATAGGDGR